VSALFAEARLRFHTALLREVLGRDAQGIPTNADKKNDLSIKLAEGILGQIGSEVSTARLAAQTSGRSFEGACCEYVRETFLKLAHLRPGDWQLARLTARQKAAIAKYEQYAHLSYLIRAARKDKELGAALGIDYTVTPDIIVVRNPEPDSVINASEVLVDENVALLTALRKSNGGLPILHASISCKWTMRSDRAQNSRTEALNLMRNRKGKLPHVVVITGEPLISRLASLALGTGDIDCLYHFALPELRKTAADVGSSEVSDILSMMVEGKRLKDISDLPMDLAT
jgi:hypothetical protein